MTPEPSQAAPYEVGELVAHVKRIRDAIRSLQGLPPLSEETE